MKTCTYYLSDPSQAPLSFALMTCKMEIKIGVRVVVSTKQESLCLSPNSHWLIEHLFIENLLWAGHHNDTENSLWARDRACPQIAHSAFGKTDLYNLC